LRHIGTLPPSRKINRDTAMMKRLIAAAAFLALSCAGASAANFCYVTEFPDAAQPVAITPALADQQVTVSTSPASTTNPFGGGTKIVRISCDTTVSAVFGVTPSAATTNMRLPANVPEYFYVIVGQKVSFITNQ
jgi:hypothetical protein